MAEDLKGKAQRNKRKRLGSGGIREIKKVKRETGEQVEAELFRARRYNPMEDCGFVSISAR